MNITVCILPVVLYGSQRFHCELSGIDVYISKTEKLCTCVGALSFVYIPCIAMLIMRHYSWLGAPSGERILQMHFTHVNTQIMYVYNYNFVYKCRLHICFSHRKLTSPL